MTSHLKIQSPFEDISQLVEGLAPFYDGTYFVLRHGAEVPEGDWVRFEVALTDGSVALAGFGKSAGVRDNGEEYGDERYDIYLVELQIDEGMSEAVWERIAMTSQASGDRATGEVDLSEIEAAEAARSAEGADGRAFRSSEEADSTAAHAAYGEEPAESAAGAHADYGAGADADESLYDTSEATVAVRLDDVAARAVRSSPPPAPTDRTAAAAPQVPRARPDAPPAPPVAPPAHAPRAAPGRRPAPAAPGSPKHAPIPSRVEGLMRPSMPASWSPEAVPPEPRPASEWFAYGDHGLPVPAAPPRPEGDVPHVQPAPRPGAQAAADA
jgi:hypothetical protein